MTIGKMRSAKVAARSAMDKQALRMMRGAAKRSGVAHRAQKAALRTELAASRAETERANTMFAFCWEW